MGTIALLVAIHLLGYVPSVELLTFMAAFAFHPWFFELWLQGHGGSPAFAYALSPIGYAFLHADFVHLGMNAVFLLAFGTEMHRRLGTMKVTILYLACAVGGAGAVMVNYYLTGSNPLVVGASGAIFGLIGAQIHAWRSQRWLLIGLFVGLNLTTGLIGFPYADGGVQIAWDAHLGGFVVGLLLFPLLAPGQSRFLHR